MKLCDNHKLPVKVHARSRVIFEPVSVNKSSAPSDAPRTYTYGIGLDVTSIVEQMPGPNTADVVIGFKGETKEFTYAEFLERLGFVSMINSPRGYEDNHPRT